MMEIQQKLDEILLKHNEISVIQREILNNCSLVHAVMPKELINEVYTKEFLAQVITAKLNLNQFYGISTFLARMGYNAFQVKQIITSYLIKTEINNKAFVWEEDTNQKHIYRRYRFNQYHNRPFLIENGMICSFSKAEVLDYVC